MKDAPGFTYSAKVFAKLPLSEVLAARDTRPSRKSHLGICKCSIPSLEMPELGLSHQLSVVTRIGMARYSQYVDRRSVHAKSSTGLRAPFTKMATDMARTIRFRVVNRAENLQKRSFLIV